MEGTGEGTSCLMPYAKFNGPKENGDLVSISPVKLPGFKKISRSMYRDLLEIHGSQIVTKEENGQVGSC
jgi:hypothetical protein